MTALSFQQVFADVSTLLVVFPDITEDTTIGELLVWIKDILEADVVDFIPEDEDGNKSDIQLELPRSNGPDA